MSQLVVDRPLGERDLHDDRRLRPVRTNARQSGGFGEGRFADFDAIEASTKIEQQLRVETSTNLAGKNEVVAFEVPHQQRAEADTSSLGIGEPADDELLARLAFHLEPVRRPAMLVERVTTLGNHAFPPFSTCTLPWLRAG